MQKRTPLATAATLALLAVAPLAHSGEETPQSQPVQRRVFAHYMSCLAMGPNISRQEVELAQRHNIDGFALNSLNWGTWNQEEDTWELGGHGKGAQLIYDAAAASEREFKLFVSIDVNGGFNGQAEITRAMQDMVERYKDHPNQFTHDGKPVLSAWAGRPNTYAKGCERLKKMGMEPCFVPFVSNSRHMMAYSPRTIRDMYTGHEHMDGFFYFAADGLVDDMLRNNAIACRVSHELGKIYMAGVAPAYNSPNLRDMKGMEGYMALWEGLIQDGADWVEIVTWNDYNEDSNLMPGRFQRGQGREYLCRDESFLDVTAYCAAWFKSGVTPTITQDKVYFTYRNRPAGLTRAWDWKEEKWIDITQVAWGSFPFDQIHDDAEDFVYLTAFLTAPAELAVSLGGETKTFAMKAGVQHARVPLAAGTPQLTLRRAGKVLADVSGRKLIVTEATKQNSPRGYHLLNRTWNNAVAIGPVQALDLADGTLAAEAALVEVAGKQAVQNAEQDGSGVTLPVKGLGTATYNVRLTYCNPAETEARLTLQADGPPRGERDYPYYLPLFLPPTGKGKIATTSFFWSLYDTTTYLNLAWRKGEAYNPEAEAKNPLFHDHGVVQLLKVELVRVEPTPVPQAPQPTHPELVAIPGGSFTMGSDDGAPDEAPRHKVTLSPFAIGTFEVTNEEFERFDPSHAQWRDAYSWRDREPVIYVKWVDAVKYCNWLSEEHDLKPVYEFVSEKVEDSRRWERMQAARKREVEKRRRQKKSLDDLPPLEKPLKTIRYWVWHEAADGFRLPTEAEWEYVASGRGEGRLYPWGNDTPQPMVHGNVPAKDILSIHSIRRSQEAMGVTVVGSFPEGASRDGVMDMAGNVGEWCHDQFHHYTAEAQTNPAPWERSNYRAIRGGSWGYYGYSQRTTDREFNNQNYPGYIYLGFRVAIGQAGYEKLMARHNDE